ncbi:MAG TPA: hypothetical protein VL094_06265 [Sphingomonadaceae bacterium]|nr:hypothetical protein [Sphingomonadaceae bacterium]
MSNLREQKVPHDVQTLHVKPLLYRRKLHHTGVQQSDLFADPRYRIPASDIVDAGLTLRASDGRHEVQMLVLNLTNAYTWNAVYLQADSFAHYAAPAGHLDG